MCKYCDEGAIRELETTWYKMQLSIYKPLQFLDIAYIEPNKRNVVSTLHIDYCPFCGKSLYEDVIF